MTVGTKGSVMLIICYLVFLYKLIKGIHHEFICFI